MNTNNCLEWVWPQFLFSGERHFNIARARSSCCLGSPSAISFFIVCGEHSADVRRFGGSGGKWALDGLSAAVTAGAFGAFGCARTRMAVCEFVFGGDDARDLADGFDGPGA